MNSYKFNPKVSIMIITYNQENLIGETIESVLSQNYDNIEIVIADDASADNTPQIIMDYAERYPTKIVPVLNQHNLGITGNSNAAFFACSGDLIAILGGDDLFLDGKIESQVKQFEDDNVVLSYHPVDIFWHQTGEVLFTTNKTKREEIKDVYDIISKGGIPGASSVMVRRSACPLHGFDPQFPVVSDWIFFIEVALSGKVAFLPGVYGKYRKHGKGASDRTFELLGESLKTLDVIEQRYATNNGKLKESCRKGKVRYVMGEVFRQISNNQYNKLNELSDVVFSNSRLYSPYRVFLILIKNKHVLHLMSSFFPKIKNIVKRYLA